jgi:O-antigen ligase
MTMYAQVLLVAALAWGAFSFGAVYPWAYWPLIAAAVPVSLVGLSMGVYNAETPTGLRWLTCSLGAFLIAGLAQLVPVPLRLLGWVSEEAVHVIPRLNLAVAAGQVSSHPLSIAPSLTRIGLVLFASNALLVLGCARLFSVGGARRVAEGLVVVGVVLALVGIVQKPLFGGVIYGFWTPLKGGTPFGPFVNRNHFAGWMLMGLPMTLGLVCGDIARALRGVKPNWHARLVWCGSPDASKLVLLAAGATVMALSLVLTMSRSGIAAIALAIVIMGGFVVRHQRTGRRAVAIAYLLVLVVAVGAWAGVDAIASSFARADWNTFDNRRGAWADAIGIASKFPATGTGLNTYGVATLFYQQHDLSKHFDEAHNDYLQLVAEGGLLLSIPAALCVGSFILAVRRRFIEETSTSAYWLRVGAVTGLTAIALQETVDFSLQVPGNAALFAVMCAIALRSSPRRHDSAELCG